MPPAANNEPLRLAWWSSWAPLWAALFSKIVWPTKWPTGAAHVF